LRRRRDTRGAPARSTTFNRIWLTNAYRDDFPEEFAHISFLTLGEARRLLERLAIGEGDTLIDVACGAGGRVCGRRSSPDPRSSESTLPPPASPPPGDERGRLGSRTDPGSSKGPSSRPGSPTAPPTP
jgi:hypothetical protein